MQEEYGGRDRLLRKLYKYLAICIVLIVISSVVWGLIYMNVHKDNFGDREFTGNIVEYVNKDNIRGYVEKLITYNETDRTNTINTLQSLCSLNDVNMKILLDVVKGNSIILWVDDSDGTVNDGCDRILIAVMSEDYTENSIKIISFRLSDYIIGIDII